MSLRSIVRRSSLAMISAVVLTVVGTNIALADDGPPPGTPTATTSAGSSVVGALFRPGSTQHQCTGTVLHSASGDLVLTAAHCLSGTAAGWTFAPDWRNGTAPYGTWTITAAYALPGWVKSGNTQDDMAILRVAPQTIGGHRRTLESVTGGAELGFAPRTGTRIEDIAYNDGATVPVGCATTTYWTGAYPTFNCRGYVGGSSGSGWLVKDGTHQRVVGLIGGLHQGGCVDYTSYSPAFGANVVELFLHAELARHGDVLPSAGSDGC